MRILLKNGKIPNVNKVCIVYVSFGRQAQRNIQEPLVTIEIIQIGEL
ncbi:hypothetical protein T190115A13A_160091 [Tenacibaculum sp. 190524A02b]|uniref:Uncharacterized protein n=1 Tax=Tenacibaculum vairaonense TaxID=3137860 RepID=A0ABP1F552_9FLAO